MTSNDDHDATSPDMANPDADRDPIAGLLDRLGGGAALVRRVAFTRIRATAAPVDVATLAGECDLTLHEVEAVLVDLVGAGTITRGPAGAVVAAGGLSVVPARHRLRLDGQQFWPWCAFDGIGIPAALGVDAVVETRCPTCDRVLVVHVEAGRPPEDSQVVGWLPGGPCGNVQADFCPEANLFCDASHLAAWRATGNHEGATASLVELADIGKSTWADIT
jgi:alkylmercury lyase